MVSVCPQIISLFASSSHAALSDTAGRLAYQSIGAYEINIRHTYRAKKEIEPARIVILKSRLQAQVAAPSRL